jgi:hypothetical protein
VEERHHVPLLPRVFPLIDRNPQRMPTENAADAELLESDLAVRLTH